MNPPFLTLISDDVAVVVVVVVIIVVAVDELSEAKKGFSIRSKFERIFKFVRKDSV